MQIPVIISSVQSSFQSSVFSKMTSTPLICCIHGVPCKKGVREVRRPSARLGESPTQTPNNSLRLPPTLGPTNEYENLELLDGRSLIPVAHESNLTEPSRRPRELASLTSENGGTQLPKSSSKASCDGVYENITMGQTDGQVHRQKNSNNVKGGKRSSVDVSDFYIGVLNRHEASSLCNERGAFRLFHKVPSKHVKFRHLTENLPLYVVYWSLSARNPIETYYAVRTKKMDNLLLKNPPTSYYVDTKLKDAPTFANLTDLVRYYVTYVYLKPNSDGTIETECFEPPNPMNKRSQKDDFTS
ncbi:hypothetical protein M3Y96_01147800 [Aphelenchoides besseyi]|nr:hypothetical protein M3Y96_01147800 [Aphelenchoides besseyi]